MCVNPLRPQLLVMLTALLMAGLSPAMAAGPGVGTVVPLAEVADKAQDKNTNPNVNQGGNQAGNAGGKPAGEPAPAVVPPLTPAPVQAPPSTQAGQMAPPPDIMLVRIITVNGQRSATLWIKGATRSRLMVGAPVLNKYLSEIRDDGVCLDAAIGAGKPRCARFVSFSLDRN